MKHFQSDRIRNKDFFIIKDDSTTFLALPHFMSGFVFDQLFNPLPIKLLQI